MARLIESAAVRSRALSAGALVLGTVLFVYGNGYTPRPPSPETLMSVALPVPLQVLYAGGDRYLAANVGAWRAIMVGTGKLPLETLQTLARVQEDVSWLNPGHEDNYYMATAVLPWEGEVAATQTVLQRATDARSTDLYPPFYFGFNKIHFLGDVQGAVDALLVAAARAPDELTQQTLTAMAARWLEKSDDTEVAIQMVRVMVANAADSALKNYLKLREERLLGLKMLRDALARYVESRGVAPQGFDDLLSAGYLVRMPVDPLDGGYSLKNGTVVLLPARR